jgi:hypothetical protein
MSSAAYSISAGPPLAGVHMLSEVAEVLRSRRASGSGNLGRDFLSLSLPLPPQHAKERVPLTLIHRRIASSSTVSVLPVESHPNPRMAEAVAVTHSKTAASAPVPQDPRAPIHARHPTPKPRFQNPRVIRRPRTGTDSRSRLGGSPGVAFSAGGGRRRPNDVGLAFIGVPQGLATNDDRDAGQSPVGLPSARSSNATRASIRFFTPGTSTCTRLPHSVQCPYTSPFKLSACSTSSRTLSFVVASLITSRKVARAWPRFPSGFVVLPFVMQILL